MGDLDWSEIEETTAGRDGVTDAPCPACSPHRKPANRRQKVLRIWREDDFATFNCKHCGLSGWARPDALHDFARRKPGPFMQAFIDMDRAERDRATSRETQARIALSEFTFFSARPIKDTLAETYLSSRGLTASDDVRFSTIAPRSYEDPAGVPGMVVAVRNEAGALTGIQATHLGPDGRKLKRLTFGKVAGGAVRLAPIAEGGVLAVAEGVETALAFTALYGVPCWAALSAIGIEQFDPPDGLTRLVIAADHDLNSRGFEAAQILARRAQLHCEAVISMPGKVGDWADELVRRQQVAA